MTSVSGIYVILHKKSGKIYLGQAQNIRKRWNEHKRDLIKGDHHNIYLQRSWNKYGAKAFQFKILERCAVNQLDEREQHYLDVYIPKGFCYNISSNAGNTRGVHPSAETKRKISESSKLIPPESRKRMVETRLKNLTAETRYAYGSSSRGKPKSADHREKIGSPQRKSYIVTDPNGIEFQITGLANFCRENGLLAGSMCGVMSGKCTHHKGWKCRKAN